MNVNFDHFDRAENPKLFICTPNNKILAPISNYTNLVIKPTFNGLSELSIHVYKYITDDDVGIVDTSRICEGYKYIESYKQIHVENIGYFIIQSCDEYNDGFNPYFEITAKSCEIELNNAALDIPDNTYQFYNTSSPHNTILGKIIDLCPNWKIGSVSDAVAMKYRTFTDLNQQVYVFMAGDMLTAYECIVVYDIENRVINVIDSNSEIESTDIFLTFKNVIQKVQVKQSSENIVTALDVSGVNNLEIRNANPLGTNVVYNLDYYKYNPNSNKEWMSQDLTNSVDAWEKKISDSTATYNDLISQITLAESEYSTLNGQLADLNTALKSLQQVENVSGIDGYAVAHANVLAKQTEVDSKQTEVNNKLAQITSLNTQLSTLQSSLSIQSNFTNEQYKELFYYIHQDKYQDENIEVTDAMTYPERLAQTQLLYARGQKILSERCQPTYTITFDCNNFLFVPEFDVFRNQFELGKIIHVEISPNNIVDFAVLQYEIDYDTKDLKITISNRLKLHDNYITMGDLQSKVTESANTITFNKDSWNYPVKSGIFNAFDNYMRSALNVTNNPLITADGQKAVFDDNGYHGFRWNKNTSTYDPEQCQLVNNQLRFTDDNWNTISCALGKFQKPDGTWSYGLNADSIVAGSIDAKRVLITGFVTVEDLATGGKTTINGDNITTGTISANRVNLSEYATIQAVTDGLEAKVSKDDLSTAIKQSPDAVVYAFNNMENQQSIKFTGDGFDFYYNSSFIGHLGVTSNPDTGSYDMCMQPASGQGGTYFSNSGSYAQVVIGKLKANELHADGLIATDGRLDCRQLTINSVNGWDGSIGPLMKDGGGTVTLHYSSGVMTGWTS